MFCIPLDLIEKLLLATVNSQEIIFFVVAEIPIKMCDLISVVASSSILCTYKSERGGNFSSVGQALTL